MSSGLQQLFQIAGEIFVDAEIAGEIAAREFREIEPVMQDRPQHAVGEAVVVFLVVVLAQIDGDVGDVVVLDGLGRPRIARRRPCRSSRTRRRRAACSAGRSQPRARRPAPPLSGTPTRLETTTSRANTGLSQLRDSLIAVKIKPGHRIGLRKIAPQFPGLRMDVLRQQAVAVAQFERVDEHVARLFAPARSPTLHRSARSGKSEMRFPAGRNRRRRHSA